MIAATSFSSTGVKAMDFTGCVMSILDQCSLKLGSGKAPNEPSY